MGSLSIWHWLIVLVIVVLVFGTKKLRGAGGDLGSAVKNFKDAVREGEAEGAKKAAESISAVKQANAAETKKDQV